MMEFVTDRTKTDVLLGTEKGQYGFADLNRVEQAVAELSAAAKKLDIHYTPVVKTDWGAPGVFSSETWPTKGQMIRYLENVSRLCQLMEIKAAIPSTMEKLTWEGANDIEQALLFVSERIRNILQILQYSGEIFAGEENYL